MIYNSEIPYDVWAEQVRVAEYLYAVRMIKGGADVETVIEMMSHRILQKMLHPVMLAITANAPTLDI